MTPLERRERVRVLQALTTAQIGGTERMVVRLAEGLRDSHIETVVSVLEEPGPISEELAALGVEVHHLELARGYWFAYRTFRRLLHAGEFDVVHLYGMRMSWLGRIAAAGRSRPVLIHGIRGLHVTESEDEGGSKVRFSMMLERLGERMIDVYVANSVAAVDFMSGAGLDRRRFVVIPNGTELPCNEELAPRDDGRKPTIVCVANFRPRKRQEDVAEAVEMLAHKGLSCSCVFVGDGTTRPALEASVVRRGLGDTITFTGSLLRHEVRALLRESDVAVLASTWEGLPGSLMEAMAAGLPVVATDVPGTRELVVDGETGFLVPVRSPAALAERLTDLLMSRELRLRMGQAGRARIAERFSMSQMIENHERLYQSLAAKRRSHR